jgi:hypothetical protein
MAVRARRPESDPQALPAVDSEETARIAADAAEASTRAATDAAEASVRASAITAETNDRIVDVDAEEAARISADSAEATARAAQDATLAAADATEAASRAAGDTAEATARSNADTALTNAITAEQAARSSGDAALIPLTQKAAPLGVGTLDASGRQLLDQRPPVPLAAAKTRWDQQSFVSIPNAIGETVVHSATGQGVVRTLWLAVKPYRPDMRLRIYVDGEATPSVDIDLGTLFLIHNFANNFQVSTRYLHAESDPTAGFNNQFGGFLRYPIPYSNGISVRLYQPSAVANGLAWCQAVADKSVTAPYRLKSQGVPYFSKATVEAASAYSFFDISPGSGWLVYHAMAEKAGLRTITATRANGSNQLTAVSSFANLAVGQTVTGNGIPAGTTILALNPGASSLTLSANASSAAVGDTYTITGWSFLERDLTIAVDGEATPAVRSSGTEDLFLGSFYYQQRGAYSTPVSAITGATATSYLANQAVDLLELCGGVKFDSRLKLDLLTEAAVVVPHEMSWASLYYVSV